MNILRRLDTILLSIIAVIAIVVACLDFSHLEEIEKIRPIVPALLTLIFLSLLALHLIASNVREEDFQKKATETLDKISKGVSLGEFHIFHDSAEMEHHLAKRVMEAKKSVCDLSWKARISEGFSSGHRKASHGNLDHCIAKASSKILYREIFVFSDARRIEKMERRLSEKQDGYSCKYYKDESRIPRLQFVIIDDEEVFFFASAAHSQLCSVRGVEFCKVFKPYFDEAWAHAIWIKDGPRIHENEVEKIRKLLASLTP